MALDDDLAGRPEEEMGRVVPCDPLLGLASLATCAELAKRLTRGPTGRNRRRDLPLSRL